MTFISRCQGLAPDGSRSPGNWEFTGEIAPHARVRRNRDPFPWENVVEERLWAAPVRVRPLIRRSAAPSLRGEKARSKKTVCRERRWAERLTGAPIFSRRQRVTPQRSPRPSCPHVLLGVEQSWPGEVHGVRRHRPGPYQVPARGIAPGAAHPALAKRALTTLARPPLRTAHLNQRVPEKSRIARRKPNLFTHSIMSTYLESNKAGRLARGRVRQRPPVHRVTPISTVLGFARCNDPATTDLVHANSARRTGWRFGPQEPGRGSKTPAHEAPHLGHVPVPVKFQSVS